MYLCEICEEGQLEMCEYFREHFLESGERVRSCPKFRPDEHGQAVIMDGERLGKLRLLDSRCVKKAMAGERVMVLSRYKAEQAERLLRAFVAEDALRNKVASVHICMENGGEIVIGGVSRDCE